MSQKQIQLDALYNALEVAGVGNEKSVQLSRDLHIEYSKDFRACHNMDWLTGHLGEFTSVYGEFENPKQSVMAILFGSYVFDPRREDNEERSADYVRNVCKNLGMSAQFAHNVTSMILSTKHNSYNIIDNDTDLVTDIDISVLGSSPEKFGEYRKNLRKEYSWMYDDTFTKAETLFFEKFSHRAHIYSSDVFRKKLEKQAKENVTAALRDIFEKLNPPGD